MYKNNKTINIIYYIMHFGLYPRLLQLFTNDQNLILHIIIVTIITQIIYIISDCLVLSRHSSLLTSKFMKEVRYLLKHFLR